MKEGKEMREMRERERERERARERERERGGGGPSGRGDADSVMNDWYDNRSNNGYLEPPSYIPSIGTSPSP